ncbi:MAG: Crp/Fnr family transcriptional regulator [Bacteroidales bacterium]
MEYSNSHLEFCLESKQSIFRGLSSREKEALAQTHVVAQYRKGDPVASEGSKPHGLICLAAGKVKVFKEGVGGREQILRMVRPLGLIGYPAVFSDNTYYASAVAIEDSVGVSFEKNTLIRLIKKNPDLALKLMKFLALELGFCHNRTVSLTQKHVRGRIAESLLVLRETYGLEEDGRTINAYMSREDIASLSNMTTSNAIRTLSHLASEDIISLDGKKIKILDSCKLQRISEIG